MWRIRNNCQSAWFANRTTIEPADDYTKNAGFKAFYLGKELAPSETTDIAIDLAAPKDPAFYNYSFLIKIDNV